MRRTRPRGGQRAQHVVHGLVGHRGELATHGADDRVGVGVRMRVHRGQHRQPRTGDAEVRPAQHALEVRGPWPRCASLLHLLECIKNPGRGDPRRGRRGGAPRAPCAPRCPPASAAGSVPGAKAGRHRRAAADRIAAMRQDEIWDADAAQRYDTPGTGMFAPEVVGPTVDRLAELAGDGRALELAIGTGRVAVPLAERGVPVTGIELSGPMIDRAAHQGRRGEDPGGRRATWPPPARRASTRWSTSSSTRSPTC